MANTLEIKIWSTSDPMPSTVDGGTITSTDNGDGTWTLSSTDQVTHFKDFGNVDDIIEVVVVKGDTLTSLNSTFNGLVNITTFAWNGECNVTDFTSAWKYCSALTSFPQMDVSRGTLFTETWSDCNSLTEFPLLDFSSGTDFNSTWLNCVNLTSFPKIDVSNGKIFTSCWSGCEKMTTFPELNFSSGTDFRWTWSGCSSLTMFTSLNFVNLEIGEGTFDGCTNLVNPSPTGTSVRNGDDAIAGLFVGVTSVNAGYIHNTVSYEPSVHTQEKPVNISGKLGFTYDGGEGSKWVHDGDDWVKWGIGGIVKTTYDELKALRDAKELVPGTRYLLTDFKTIYQQPESNIVNTSTEGVADGLDTEVEELMLFAVSNNAFNQYVMSPKYPHDVIKYLMDLDLTGGKAPHKGGIFYREDTIQGLKTTYDWRTIKYRRYALTAPDWDDKKDYKKGDPCRVGDRLFLALRDHTNKEPVANDATYWMTVFYDLKSKTDLEYNTAKKSFDVDRPHRTFGFDVDATKYKDYYTFAILSDPDNSSGIHNHTRGITNVSILNTWSYGGDAYPDYYALLSNNVLMLEDDCFTEGGISDIYIGKSGYSYWNTIRPNKVAAQINLEGIDTFSNCYLTGRLANISASGVYLLKNSFIRGMDTVQIKYSGIENSIMNLQTNDSDDKRLCYRSGINIIDSYVYPIATKGISFAHEIYLEDSVLAGSSFILDSREINMYECEIYDSIEATSITTDSGYRRNGWAAGTKLQINAPVINSVLMDVDNLTINGKCDGVEFRQCKDVTIPSNVTLTEVKFNIPKWYGKNTWPSDPFELKNVIVSRKWSDNVEAPTVEKLWYEEVNEVDGSAQWIELK